MDGTQVTITMFKLRHFIQCDNLYYKLYNLICFWVKSMLNDFPIHMRDREHVSDGGILSA